MKGQVMSTCARSGMGNGFQSKDTPGGSRDEAVNTALEWETNGWTARVASRRKLA